MLSNTNYAICVRVETSFCGIQYTACTDTSQYFVTQTNYNIFYFNAHLYLWPTSIWKCDSTSTYYTSSFTTTTTIDKAFLFQQTLCPCHSVWQAVRRRWAAWWGMRTAWPTGSASCARPTGWIRRLKRELLQCALTGFVEWSSTRSRQLQGQRQSLSTVRNLKTNTIEQI